MKQKKNGKNSGIDHSGRKKNGVQRRHIALIQIYWRNMKAEGNGMEGKKVRWKKGKCREGWWRRMEER